MAQTTNLSKLETLFQEEQWKRLDPAKPLFSHLDDLFNSLAADNLLQEAAELCHNHLSSGADSIVSLYILGLCGYQTGFLEDTFYIRKLTDIFIANQKWTLAELVADRILEYGENAAALRAKAVSLEHLNRSKEAVPFFEELLKINRFDADVAQKLSDALAEENADKSTAYLKLAAEGYIRGKKYDNFSALMQKLVSRAWDDIGFFERIDRMLADNKQSELAVDLLKSLLAKYKSGQNNDVCIALAKKFLFYKPDENSMRKELVRLYREKYDGHDQLEQFIKLSGINNFKHNVKTSIQNFENYIILSAGNYVYHSSWKLGKIRSMNSENVTVDFKDKENHQMTIDMALRSLTPMKSDHIYVLEYEDAAAVKKLFAEDFTKFFDILIKSFGGEMSLADIKYELVPKYIDEKNWSKWWNRARTEIKKSPLFGISDKKRDVFYKREHPITYVGALLDKFNKSDSFTEKLDLAIEFVNNAEGASSDDVSVFIDYFASETKGGSDTRLVLSYFILKDFTVKYETKFSIDAVRDKVINFVKTAKDLPLLSMKINSYDYKKDFVNLTAETREDWASIVSEFLFETPIRIHKYIFNRLLMANEYNTVNNFIDKAITGARAFPDTFLWTAKSLLNKVWQYEWLDYSKRDLTLALFRLINELRKIETDGNRLKSQAIDILFAGDSQVLKDIVNENDKSFLGRLYDLLADTPYIEESQLDRFIGIIKERFADFTVGQTDEAQEQEQAIETFIVTEKGFKSKQEELDNMTTVEMNRLAKELSEVADANADPKENVEYAALLEKQAILKASISRLDQEMKTATILNPDAVSTEAAGIGTKVGCENTETGELRVYTILGPWDADFRNGILSYRSPIAKAILGKKLNEEFVLKIDDNDAVFKITSIDKAEF